MQPTGGPRELSVGIEGGTERRGPRPTVRLRSQCVLPYVDGPSDLARIEKPLRGGMRCAAGNWLRRLLRLDGERRDEESQGQQG